MGANLALNIESRGFSVAVFNRTGARTEEFARSRATGRRIVATFDMGDFAASLSTPRRVILMVQAGDAVDSMLAQLLPHLVPGDIVVDGGNSFFQDTIRREKALGESGIRFVGMGISGGEEGALHGPSLMPGGDPDAYRHIEPILTEIAATTEDGPCVTYVGQGGAGHFVKMVHNGIEYADMQLIAEAYDLLRHGLGLTPPQLRRAFAKWNRRELSSYLTEITADILGHYDEEGVFLLDVILDSAEQKGTGRWASATALDLGVPVPSITAAVDARYLSAIRDERLRASSLLGGLRVPAARRRRAAVRDVRAALYASKVCAYAQGMALLRAADAAYSFGLRLDEIARIWKAGCIIRARFLDDIRDAFLRDSALQSVLLDPFFRQAVVRRLSAWRRTVRRATRIGVAAPAMSASLAYFDGYRRARGPAALIQAQRDYFGAHTYRRTDREGVFHTDWKADQRP
jgi:6-phosphogluconate dehydrogenase